MMKLPVNYDEMDRHDRRLVRDEYEHRQDGKCYHCRASLSGPSSDEVLADHEVDETLFPEGFFKYPIHLHHSHTNGMTIGAVHAYCNAVLWQYHGE